MANVPYNYKDIISSDMSYTIDPNQKLVRDIRIDDVTKTEDYLIITSENVMNKIKLDDLKKIVKLIMEE